MAIDVKDSKKVSNPFDGNLVFSNPKEHVAAIADREVLFKELQALYVDFRKTVTSVSATHDVEMSVSALFTIIKTNMRRN